MTEAGDWKTLMDSEDYDAVVLAVDFDTTGRPEARFSDLVANLKSDFAVWETIPPAAGTELARTATGYIDHWARKAEAERRPVRALLGFCAGSVYAAALAERIRGWQDTEPLLLLFDPELSTSQTLMWQFHKVIGFLSSIISAEEIAEGRAAGQQVYDRIPDVGALKDALIELMRGAGEPALVRAGLDKPRREELFGVFDSFLCYLATASEIDPLDRWRSAIALSSTSPLSGLNAMRTAGMGAEQITVAREITFEVDHATMLANKDVAATVSDLLNG
jgi:hypothetical protein